MEFSILGIRNEASLDEAKRALRQIRINNHPDKNITATILQLQSLQHLVILAEEALHRIEAQKKVTMAVDNAIHNNKRMRQYHTANLSNIFDNMDLNNRSQESFCTYQNINGNVQEFGTINGKPMTQEEINHKYYQK